MIRRVLLTILALTFVVGAGIAPAAAKSKPPPPILFPPGITQSAPGSEDYSPGPTYVITPGGTATALPPKITDPADMPSGVGTAGVPGSATDGPSGTGTDAATPGGGSDALAGPNTPANAVGDDDGSSVPLWALGAGAGLLLALAGVLWRQLTLRRNGAGEPAEDPTGTPAGA